MDIIVKVVNGASRHYEIEHKFWWGWKTYSYEEWDIYLPTIIRNYKFETIEEAEKFIKDRKTSSNIIKYIK